jgi:uncharacterized membrane protein YgaE (UPF0421/DUF939 family)
MTTEASNRADITGLQRVVHATASGTALAIAALVSYELATRILISAISSRDDQMLGGMWSAVATLFVCRESYRQGITAAFSRTVATLLSFALCLGYLLLFPFSPWGMAILIGIGAVVLILINRPEDVITNTITTAVVMVVAGISPQHAWMQPILRLGDTFIGLVVGIVAVSIVTRLSAGARLAQKKSQWKITKETL